MHTMDDRYHRQHRNVATAIRMIGYEARTNTISACTGLTDDKIRKLYKAHMAQRGSNSIRRRRGKSPHQVESLVRNADVQMHAGILAAAFVVVGLLESDDHRTGADPCNAAELLCDAYEIYRQQISPQELDFEHAWFLWQTLSSSDELQLDACDDCGGLIVRDRFALRARPCPWCQAKQRDH